MALFSLATGALVLLGALATSRYQRLREAVLLKTLGATRRQLLQIVRVEYLGLGVLGALTAVALSSRRAGRWCASSSTRASPRPLAPLPLLSLAVVALTVGVGLLEQPGPVPPHAARGAARRMKRSDWRLIRIALALGLLPASCSWPTVRATTRGPS